MSEISIKQISRRNFLQWTFSFLSLGVFAAVAHVAVHYLLPPPKPKKARDLSIPTAQIPRGTSLIVEYRGAPVIVVHTDEKFVAFAAACTHLGCLVKWSASDKNFICPCHAGKFDIAGKVVAGPPPEPLHAIDIEIVDDTITFV